MVFNKHSFLLLVLCTFLMLMGCNQPEPIHDLSDKSFSLLNQDSTSVQFPADFEGKYLVVSFIFTHCPDICPVTTANMKNISTMLEDTADVEFIAITFDPRRDTPSVLKKYMQNFKLNENTFTMLTGDSTSITSVMNAMDIDAAVAYRDTTKEGEVNYTMNHTDRILVMDSKSRVRFEYPGSKVPPEHIVEDLQKIR